MVTIAPGYGKSSRVGGAAAHPKLPATCTAAWVGQHVSGACPQCTCVAYMSRSGQLHLADERQRVCNSAGMGLQPKLNVCSDRGGRNLGGSPDSTYTKRCLDLIHLRHFLNPRLHISLEFTNKVVGNTVLSGIRSGISKLPLGIPMRYELAKIQLLRYNLDNHSQN